MKNKISKLGYDVDQKVLSPVDFNIPQTRDRLYIVAKENNRPKMKLKKLQVPIKMEKKKKTSAKLRKRVVAKKARVTANDIKMPEITGITGGLGAMQGGEGLGSDIGFTMPEINFFGAKQRSE